MKRLQLRHATFEEAQAELLRAQIPQEGLLVVSRWPLDRGKNVRRKGPVLRDGFETERIWVPLVWGPSAFYWCYPCTLLRFNIEEWVERNRAVLVGYRSALESLASAKTYEDTLRAFLAWEEEQFFPQWTAYFGDDRLTRELGYEHDGLRKALDRFPDLVQRWLQGDATRRELDKMELDLHHLFEHHWERKEALVRCYSSTSSS